jgi:thiol-disulfide isomerase/thioredoxin
MDILSSTSSSTLKSFNNSNKKCKVVIYIIILLIVIIFIYNMFFKTNYKNYKNNKDTIIFYVADWCPHCQKLKPFINECKKLKLLNIKVKNAEKMNDEEKKQINGFPTAIRNSDNNIAVGEIEIKNLVNQTLNKSNIEYFDAREDIIFYLDDSSNFYLDASSNLLNLDGSLNYINLNNNQSVYNLRIKYQQHIEDTDTDFSGNIINSFPTAVIQSNKKTYYGYNDVFSLLEQVLKTIIFEDTIDFYVADWCAHCETIKSYIKDLKNIQQTKVKINIVNYDDMNDDEKKLIVGFPAVKRNSDNMIGFGQNDIEKIVNNSLYKTLLPSTQEDNAANYDSKDTIQFYIAEWCGHSQKLFPYIEDYQKQQNVVNVEIFFDKDIPSELNITGYPTAIRKSDNKRAVGAPSILNLMKETAANNNNIQEVKQENNSANYDSNNSANYDSNNSANYDSNNSANYDSNNSANYDSKDTIQFYIAEWCGHSQKLLPYIEDYQKQQNVVNVEIFFDKDIPSELNITGYPTAIRKSDNKRAVGGPSILNLMKETAANNNNIQEVKQENNSANYDSKDTIQFYMAEWCDQSHKILPYIEEYQKQQNVVDTEIIYEEDIPMELNITDYPTAIRKSDNKKAVGVPTILNLMKETMIVVENNNIQEVKQENHSANNKIIVFLAEWCSYCQKLKPQLIRIMKTNKNIELVDSKDITPDLQKYIQRFPSALKVSDNTVAVGAPEILKMINSNTVNKPDKKQTCIFVYSDNCKYCQMIMPKWLEFKLHATDNKLNVNILEYESKDLDKLPDNYKNQIEGFPTLFVNEKYEGYDDIINYLKKFS